MNGAPRDPPGRGVPVDLSLGKTGSGSESLGAWFLGPVAENRSFLSRLFLSTVRSHARGRSTAYPGDPAWITRRVKRDPHFRHASRLLQKDLEALSDRLLGSVPFFSYRYQGHMLWDVTLPAVTGYFAAMLYNQNNVAAEASPVTTALEKEVGADLCRMLGYTVNGTDADGTDAIGPWGHVTCDGSVANIEALWVARNLKAYPLAIARALDKEQDLQKAKDIEVDLANGKSKGLLGATAWELLNVKADDVLALPGRITEKTGLKRKAVESLIQKHTLQHAGIPEFCRSWHEFGDLVFLCSATGHYSLPKASTLLGFGKGAMLPIRVDLDARMSMEHLRSTLEDCVSKNRPVAAVVAVIGSTEQSAVDPLEEILKIRENYRQKGLDFLIHADAAWGGYFASLLRDPDPGTQAFKIKQQAGLWDRERHRFLEGEDRPPATGARLLTNTIDMLRSMPAMLEEMGPDAPVGPLLSDAVLRMDFEENVGSVPPAVIELQGLVEIRQALVFTPEIAMSKYVQRQYKALPQADSITVDPHKAGYIPYPAGALCYRNGAMRDMVTIEAPVVYRDDKGIGIYGIEGSKPGAAPAAVWVTHRVIRPDQSGYGRILGRCLFNSKRFYAALVTMAEQSDPFLVKTIQRLPSEADGGPNELDRIQEFVDRETNEDLWEYLTRNPDEEELFRKIGPDQLITAYAFNFKTNAGPWNAEVSLANTLNRKTFERLSTSEVPQDPNHWVRPELVITSSKLDPKVCGEDLVRSYMKRLELAGDPQPIYFLISTTMNPWLTDTDNGTKNMIPDLIAYLRKAVEAAVNEVRGP